MSVTAEIANGYFHAHSVSVDLYLDDESGIIAHAEVNADPTDLITVDFANVDDKDQADLIGTLVRDNYKIAETKKKVKAAKQQETSDIKLLFKNEQI